MSIKSFRLFAVALTLFFTTALTYAQNCTSTSDLPNFGCVNPKLYRGGQPTQAGIRELAKRGIKTVINLRDADENAGIEKRAVIAAGMRFYNLPLSNWLGPGDSKIEEILSLINSRENQPVFVHCKRGADRIGTVLAVYRISHDGWTAKEAKTEAKKFRLGWWQFWMKDYIEDYQKEHVRNPVDIK